MSSAAPLSEAKRSLLQRYIRGEFAREFPSDSISKRPPQAPVPLTVSQEQVVIREKLVPAIPPLYNESVTVYRFGSLDVNLLERSFTEVIRRHEIWRTTYATLNGNTVQVVRPASDHIRLPLIDLRAVPREQRSVETARIMSPAACRPFDMQEGPLVRASLVRFDEEEYRLYLIVHQSILDGVSVYQVLLSELATLYNAYAAGAPSPLPDPAIQFGDYSFWQRRYLQDEILERQLAYWRRQLAGETPALAWPRGKPRPPQQSFRGSIQPFAFPLSLTESVKALGRQAGSTLFALLLTAFAVVLHSYTRQEEIVIGTVSPVGRKRSEVQKLMGYFLNPVALRFHMTPDQTFQKLLCHVQDVVSGALSHDEIPFEYLVRELRATPDPSRNPFFTVAASLEPPLANTGPQWNLTPMDIESGGARWDLYFVWDDRSNGMIGRVQYNPDLFENETINRMILDFRRVLEMLIQDPRQKISDLCRDPVAPSSDS
jgi:condensation domain-containing protein